MNASWPDDWVGIYAAEEEAVIAHVLAEDVGIEACNRNALYFVRAAEMFPKLVEALRAAEDRLSASSTAKDWPALELCRDRLAEAMRPLEAP